MSCPHSCEGVLVVDKEQGPTSHDIVASLRNLLGLRRVGHCGPLYPLAPGVLVVCLGQYTRLALWLGAGEKEYLCLVHLGATSSTGDAQGEITPHPGGQRPTPATVAQALAGFTGWIEQVPPVHSAVKVFGVRSYELARRREPVELAPRRIHIAGIEVVDYDYPRLVLRIACSRGTYIRSLASDLGAHLGCGAFVAELRRLRSGCLDLRHAWSLAAIGQACREDRFAQCLVPVGQALADLPRVCLRPATLRRFAHGNPVSPEDVGPMGSSEYCAVFATGGEVCYGIGKWDCHSGWLNPKTVLHRDAPEVVGEVAHG
jgi:tRNA pseudouridine55 synthase